MPVVKDNAQFAGPRRLGHDPCFSGNVIGGKSGGRCSIVEEQSNLQLDFYLTINMSAAMPPEVRCRAIILTGVLEIIPKPGLNLALLPKGHLDTWAKVYDS